MTEMVTNAAFLQPLLQPTRLQAFGASNPDLSQADLQISGDASRQDAAVTAAEVPETSDNRSTLLQDSDSLPDPNLFWSLASNQEQPVQEQPAVSVGPSKARVDLPPLQLSEPASQPDPVSTVSSQPAQSAPDVTAAAQPAPTSDASSDSSAATTQSTAAPVGVLGAPEELSSLTIESMSDNIFGVAFAPLQVGTTPSDDVAAALHEKNFIFSQRVMYGDNAVTNTKIAVQPTGKFAAAVSSTSDSDSQITDREGLFLRAQAIANALGGGTSQNPQVKKLMGDLENYRTSALAQTGADARPPGHPSVVVTA